VSELDRHRLSFDSVAASYERSRPRYAPDAIAWTAERLPFGRVLDLGAGTGKLTRQLVEAGADVVAVEPGPEMRAVFARVLPEVELLEGSAEAIPLGDGTVDTVTAAQAFHWFRPDEALPEMHRVLRPGGGVALFWNEWDEADPLMRALNGIVGRLRQRQARDDGLDHPLERTALFENLELRKFTHVDVIPIDVALERVASVSAVIVASPEDRAAAFADVRCAAGDGDVRFQLVTTVAAADRV
jgi:SAM-dependent methyltransferase